MYFTMRYTAHPERKTTFTKVVEAGGRIHALIQKGCPWKNGIIERSNRTDNEECFSRQRFRDSEHRRYQHRLWEMHYNTQRPHQGLDNQTPLQVLRENYPLHTATRMILT